MAVLPGLITQDVTKVVANTTTETSLLNIEH